MASIRRIAEDWFIKMMMLPLDRHPNSKWSKPGALLSLMPEELKDLKSRDVQVPFQKDWYTNET